MELPIYDLIISDKVNDDAEVSFVALVDKPAIKRDFFAFTDVVRFAIQSEDEHIVTGPLMIPDQLIYRNSEKLGEHYVKFTADTIKQIAIKFIKKGYQCNVNLMHDASMQVEGCTMFESFISDTKRGVKCMEQFADLPDGTWFGSFYIENPEVWQLVKQGQVRGFSVEGLFDYEKPISKEEQTLRELGKILNSFQ